MSIYRRKAFVVRTCSGYTGCIFFPPSGRPPPAPPLAPPPLTPPNNQRGVDRHKHYLPSIAILIFCVLGVALFLFVSLAFLKKYYSNSNNSWRRNPPTFEEDDDDEEDFVDENHGPVLDHHIWYINTVGLEQSMIESIAVFKYKRDDGLIEGTDCSVCLSEFEEDETLRLLPKCSHAFHVPCIDTWLRSHKNCPLCRAPIVCDANSAHGIAAELNLNELGPSESEVTRVENLENNGGLGSHEVGEEGTNEVGVGAECFGGLPTEEGTITEILTKDLRCFDTRNSEFRVVSDLADSRQEAEEELKPVRRSISMDAASASRIYRAVANIPQVKLEGCSSTRLVQVKKPNSEMVVKPVKRNSSIYGLMKSSSIGRSLQKGPVAMKRSLSSSRRFSLPRIYSRSQDSILPL